MRVRGLGVGPPRWRSPSDRGAWARLVRVRVRVRVRDMVRVRVRVTDRVRARVRVSRGAPCTRTRQP